MAYTGQQRFLIRDAKAYLKLGYRVGFAKGKKFLREYKDVTFSTFLGRYTLDDENYPNDFDGISLIPDGIVCVDIDVPDFGVVYEDMPPTLKEKTPRGWHLWYLLPTNVPGVFTPKIKWRSHVDLLVKDKSEPKVKRMSSYSGQTDISDADDSVSDHWGEHVLCSGTAGYQRIWPVDIPTVDQLPMSPRWLQDALRKK